MHGSLMVLTILAAAVWRWRWRSPDGTWQVRWVSALSAFCLPPLMIVLAAAAVLSMGHHGTMMGRSVSPVGCWASLAVLAVAGGVLGYALGRVARIQWWLHQYPVIALPGEGLARCLPLDLPLMAQVGLWRSSLLVSRGWLERLSAVEQRAMLAHEQAHADYRDPFWFFWLGVVRRFTGWLPNTQSLWEDLLLLRELRADQQAARTSDPLLLAELLVKLSREMTLATQPHALNSDMEPWVGFNAGLSLSRLEQRVNALIELEQGSGVETQAPELGQLAWWMVAMLPLASIGLHT